jgi:hypothetical protein
VGDKLILILCVIGLVCGLYVAQSFLQARGKLRRRTSTDGLPTKISRAGDRRILSPNERQVIDRVKKLSQDGHFVQASQLLEQIGFHREAISLLEDKKLLDEAAAILLRLQKPNRVGVLYARNGMWKKAAPFFMQACHYLDAAKAYREAGQHKEAADLFRREQEFVEAAQCFAKIGYYLDAARCWSSARREHEAINCWNKYGMLGTDRNHPEITEPEYELMINAVVHGGLKKGLITLLAHSPLVKATIIACVKSGANAAAKEILTYASPERYLEIIAETSIESTEGRIIAAMLSELDHHKLAANLFERFEYFAEAAAAYSAAGDMDRADYCRSRLRGDQSRTKSPHAVESQFFLEPTKNNIDIPQSWLFRDLPADLFRQFTARLSPMTLEIGQRVTSGSMETKLVYVLNGELVSGSVRVNAGEWAGVDASLGELEAISWVATSSTNVVFMTAKDFDHLFNKYALLSRIVYRNLTQQLQRPKDNHKILKAI